MSPRHRQLEDATLLSLLIPAGEAEIYPGKCAQAAYTRLGQRAAECRVPTSLKKALSIGAGSLGHILWTIIGHY